MKLSLRMVSIRAVEAYKKKPRNEWVLEWPGQVVLAASQIHWTAEVTQVCIIYFDVQFIKSSTLVAEKIVLFVGQIL